jgi:AmmeMemoRadiSam system protein A
MRSEADRRRLLRTAREAIVSHVTGGRAPATTPATINDAGDPPGAAFVTIHTAGALRGCIGNLGTDRPVSEVVRECAVAACSADPRFEPVTPAELPALTIEISLLGPFEPVSSAEEIAVGRHGLLIEQGWQRGLLLPQVATEWGWDRETFLSQTCHKAGLAPDAWKRGARIFRFEAEVFGDDHTSGTGATTA